MLINNLIRGGSHLNRLLLRQLATSSYRSKVGLRQSSSLWSQLNIEKFVEFDKLDLYGQHYDNPEKLSELRKHYKEQPQSMQISYRYIRELNRQRKYPTADAIAEKVLQSHSPQANSKLGRFISYQQNYAAKHLPFNPEDIKLQLNAWKMWKRYIFFLMFPLLLLLAFSKNVSSETDLLSEMLSGKNVNKEERNITTRFSDVLGIDEFKDELIEIVDYLKHPQKYENMGAKLPKGVLLVGPPGTGKTLLARAIAGEAGCSFFYKAGAEFDEMFVGVGASRVRQLFKKARQSAPSIIFIDEIDSAAAKRNSYQASYSRDTINQLLAEMDGFKPTDNVIVIGATNFEDAVDPAIKRPGRFDKIIHIPLPDVRGRQAILNHYLKKIKYSAFIDLQGLSRRSTGFSGADIQNMVNVAILNAVRNGIDASYLARTSAQPEDFEYAYDRIKMGVGRKKMYISPQDRKLTAYHELGHVLTAMYTEGATPVHKVTILPRGGALGFTATVPTQDNLHMTKKSILATIDVAMGGRAAEQLFFGNDQITTGCSDDLKKASQLAYLYVSKLGMNEQLNLASTSDGMTMSDEYRYAIDKEVDRILKSSYRRVKDLLKNNEKKLRHLTKQLIERETLSLEDIQVALLKV